MKIKYIRTKDERIIPFLDEDRETKLPERHLRFYYIQPNNAIAFIDKNEIIKQANTIEELCDMIVAIHEDNSKDFYEISYPFANHISDHYYDFKFGNEIEFDGNMYGCIWTDKGLKYIAKMNKEGKLELI